MTATSATRADFRCVGQLHHQSRCRLHEGTTMNAIQESEKTTPIVEETDVLVCGGGPAGVAAAVAAARAGARTRLIEMHGALGGIWTIGAMAYVCGINDSRKGILCEIQETLKQRGAVGQNEWVFDIEPTKLLLEELCLRSGVHVRLHTRVAAAHRDASNRLSAVITESKSGREAWKAKVVIDATGDGDVAALAGCGFDVGRPGSGETQPMSFIAVVSGVHLDEIRPYTHLRKLEPGEKMAIHKERLRSLLEKAGAAPSYSHPTLFHVRDDLFVMMSNHEYARNAMNANDLTEATLRGRAEVHAQIQALRGLGGVWKDICIVATSANIGVREGRRIHGRYAITADDLVSGARHPDAVSRCHFCVDVHATNPKQSKGYDSEGIKALPYDIPLRALIAKDVDGLMMAGRCISGDFLAHASYRVTAEAVPMGEAAGLVAAAAAKSNTLPHETPWEEIRRGMPGRSVIPSTSGKITFGQGGFADS